MFTLVQSIIIAFICAIAWGRPVILNDITSSNAAVVGVSFVALWGFNRWFTYQTEYLLRKQRNLELERGATAMQVAVWLWPRWLLVAKELEKQGRRVQPTTPGAEPTLIENIPAGVPTPLDHKPPAFLKREVPKLPWE